MMTRLVRTNRLLAAGMLVLTLTGAGGMFLVGHTLSDISGRLHPMLAEEQRRLKRQLLVDAQVEEALGTLAEQIDADRTLVFLAHNGTTDLTGRIPFMFLSNVYAHLRPGTAWHERWSRPQPLSIYSPTLRRVFKNPESPVCVKRRVTDPDLTEMARAGMKDRGTEAWFVCPLHGVGGVAGFVLAEYLHHEAQAMPDAEVSEHVSGIADFIHRVMVAK